MRFLQRRLVRRVRDDVYEIDLEEDFRLLLVALAEQLDPLLDSDGPAVRRLYPTAYSDDPERDAGFQILARGELVDQRREAIAHLRATAMDEVVDEDTITSWMAVVNDLRLVLGTQLDVGEDDHDISIDDPNAAAYYRYHWLGLLLSEIVDAMSEGLPD